MQCQPGPLGMLALGTQPHAARKPGSHSKFWPTANSQPQVHQTFEGEDFEMIPDPSTVWLSLCETCLAELTESPELWEVIINNCCFKSPNFSLVCDAIMDNKNSQQILLISLCVCMAMPWGLWDFSSLTRDPTWGLGRESSESNHWTAREFPDLTHF